MKLFLLLLLLQSCSHLFYQPSEQKFYNPQQFNLEYRDVYFESKDGTQLHGWFLPSQKKPSKGTFILFHGNAQNISTHFLNLAWLVKDHPYNLFIFDYRGYGKSQGKAHQEGLYLDALAALDKGRELHLQNGGGRYIVYGQSLGGIVSLRALADYPKSDQIFLVVMDSTFASYRDVAFQKLTSRWFLIPFSPLALATISDEYASDEVFDRIHVPVLVIAGQKDQIIPPENGDVIFEGLPTKEKWIWKLPEGKHIDVFHGSQEVYRKKFLDFLDSLDQK